MKSKSRNCLAGCALSLLSAIGAAQSAPDDSIGSFEIGHFSVEGDTLLGAVPIAQLLAPFTGKERHFSDVQLAIESLEEAYRVRGMPLVRVLLPEQELNQGTVQLTVIETRIGKVTISGNKNFDTANIRRSLPALREGQSPDLTHIAASLRLANENPAKKTTLSLQSSANDEAVDATLQVVDQSPWAASLALDNAGGDKTGRTQVTGQLQHHNIAGLDHSLSLQFTTTLEQPSKVGVYGMGYHIPLYALGDALDFYGSYSDVDSGTVSTGAFNLQVSGKGAVMGGRYTHNLARHDNYASRIAVGLEQKAFQNNLDYQGLQLGNDVTVRPLSIIYAGDLTRPTGVTNYYLMGVRNVPGGDHSSELDFSRIRAGATPAYGVLRYGLSHTQQLPSDWQLRFMLNGQVSRDALVPGEQFGAGGAVSVRGYGERAVSDDQGTVANLELYTPGLCAFATTPALDCRLLAFYDAAGMSRNNALPGERTSTRLSSAGIGMRLTMSKTLSAQMDVGQVLTDIDTQSRGDRRVHLKMNLAY